MEGNSSQLSPIPPLKKGGIEGWLLRALAVLLFIAHAALTLYLLGGSIDPLLDDQPLLEGAHAAKFYHGLQVAQAVRERGLSAAIYDPAYQAGYLMPPWATMDSRVAAMACWLAPEHPQRAYKLGVILIWLALPGCLWLMCRIGNSGSGAICAALLLFVTSAWSPWGLALVRNGEMDVLLGTAALGLALSAMVRCYARPRWWPVPLGLLANAAAFYFWPVTIGLLFICFLLLLSLLAGRLPWPRFWGLIFAMLGGIALNSVWLHEAWQSWWMLGESEARAVVQMNQSVNIKENLQLLIWPGLLLVVGYLCTATLRPAIGGRSALVWSTAIVLTALAAIGPLEIDNLQLGKTHGWWWCSMWLAALPIGKFAAVLLESASRLIGGRAKLCLLITLLAAGAVLALPRQTQLAYEQMIPASPLSIGKTPDLLATIDLLHQQTTPQGRILWEETPATAAWAPLLPWMAERPFIGGLGCAEPTNLEMLQLRLIQGTMQGRSLELWSDVDLQSLSDTFNVGWIVAFHPTSQQRLKQWPMAELVAMLPRNGKLYRLNRSVSYCRQGKAQVLTADPHRITLTNIVPEEGEIVLSFHWHPKMRVSNARIKLESWQQPYDGVPMIRLKVPDEMSRLTIQW
jgi:hypothetical protein